MDDIAISNDDLVHLVRLAISGKTADVEMFVRKLVRRLAKSHPAAAQSLLGVLESDPSRGSFLRDGSANLMPVDSDSRLELARTFAPDELNVVPVWDAQVESALTQVVAEREKGAELAEINLRPARTVLFTGLPGVGKSLAARWLAHKLNLPLVVVDLSSVMSSFLGKTGNNVRTILDYAKATPCVLFLDEIDALAKRRDDVSEVGELKRLVTVLLQEIEMWDGRSLMLAATNHPDLLDPAVWRRFDMVVEFPLPNLEQLNKAVAIFLPECKQLSPEIPSVLATLFVGSSYSDVQRELQRTRREQVVSGDPLELILQRLIRTRIHFLPNAKRQQVAIDLAKTGYSQRRIQELTGVSRDTIRKRVDAIGNKI